MIDERDWVVVGPWWKWGEPRTAAKGRASAPAIQKYDAPSLVNDFLKDPQRSLKYSDAIDRVNKVIKLPALPQVGGKNRRPSDTAVEVDPKSLRKIFLTTHKRFYLVACELHCDAPGFPRAAPDKICEVGLVVRRRRLVFTKEARAAGADVMRYAGQVKKQVERIEAAMKDAPAPGEKGLKAAMKRAAYAAAMKARPAAMKQRADAEARLLAWRLQFNVDMVLDGWFPHEGAAKVGAWAEVGPAPVDLAGEATIPMYPLFADPTVPDHPAKHGTIYFAQLPTGGSDTDDGGYPRFDDQTTYEAYCYVKRHGEAHAKGAPCPCPHGIFWSAATEPYQLASHFDLDGTSNNPVVVQLPDLDDLAARAKPSFGLGFKKPPGSIMIAGDKSGNIASSGRGLALEICFFAIPLITIVATFVFELFLPVVVLLFGLFFLLRLKLCIPPSISISAQAHLDLEAKVEADIAVNGAVDASLGATLDATANAELIALFPDPKDTAKPPTIESKNVKELKKTYTTGALAQMDVELAAASARASGDTSAAGPSLTAGLEWETEVEWR